ncbi:MAG: hypothetical protein JNL10_15575 [Verrucomicrobiales bacterium]|nr:hypothetical protein [Verrucomicrobiales bacterium]
MKTETCLEIQAYVDGELDLARRASVETLCSEDPTARRLLEDLASFRDCIQGHEPEFSVPETREFYWNQIQRQLKSTPSPSAPTLSPWLGWVRWLVPVAGLAAVAFLITLPRSEAPVSRTLASMTPASMEASSVVYRSEADGVTVHWIN